ncbi:MAG: GTPase ObgE [Oscillospiraceae bacterium]|nr:GTPase ObgE [Oscillospiraceae bacterium]
MFVDVAEIRIKSGSGGNGAVSFHREKYVSAGGPDGGDGGKGGDVILKADPHLNTLVDFRYRVLYVAKDGENGGRNNCSGKSAPDTVIRVPSGTIVKDKETGNIIVDMSQKESFVIASGGRGGRGNQHFATSSRQAPQFAIPGEDGVSMELILELKLLADVGLIGLPNVGKSTLISVISNARPKIANYHFTTLQPNLGVVSVGEGESFVVADIPGLIEGASAGVGLGHAFLRHVERCRMLWHVVDAAALEGENAVQGIEVINKELACFSEELAQKPQVLVANKLDLASKDQVRELEDYAKCTKVQFFGVSALERSGLDSLKKATLRKLEELPPIKVFESDFDDDFAKSRREGIDNGFEIEVEDGVFRVKSKLLLRILKSVDLFDCGALLYFQKMLVKMGVDAQLRALGIKEKDVVIIDGIDFDFEYTM